MLGDTEQKGLLGVAPGHKKTWRYLAERLARGRWATQKSGLPSWFQIRESKGTGATGLPKRKKAGRLQVSAVSLDTWVPMSPALSMVMSMQVSMPVKDKGRI